MQPNVGQIVYYKSRGSLDGKFPKINRAAIVTDTRCIAQDSGHEESAGTPVQWQVRLAVLNPDGLLFSEWLEHGQEGGQWSFIGECGVNIA